MKASFKVDCYIWFLSNKRIITETEKVINKTLICTSKLRPYIGIRQRYRPYVLSCGQLVS